MGYRFKKGSKVEVLYKKDVPSGSWWCAEILSGNGHTYHVRYDQYLPSDIMRDGVVERVPRTAIRPCPPPLLERPKSWVPGDVVEVFNNGSWKHAEISEVLDGGYYFVRLAGSPRELIAHLYQLRLLQSWQDGKWVVLHKDSDMVKRVPNEGNFSHQKLQPSAGVKKKKKKRIEKEGRCQRLVKMHAPQLRDDNQSIASSVGSCSPHSTPCGSIHHLTKETGSHSDAESFVGPVNQSYNTPCRSIHGVTEDLGSHSDDDESISGSVRQPSPRTKQALAAAAEIHRQELHAYRSILVAFHALGPISWDRQVLMTDLRLMLNISTDEHLLELKNLLHPS